MLHLQITDQSSTVYGRSKEHRRSGDRRTHSEELQSVQQARNLENTTKDTKRIKIQLKILGNEMGHFGP